MEVTGSTSHVLARSPAEARGGHARDGHRHGGDSRAGCAMPIAQPASAAINQTARQHHGHEANGDTDAVAPFTAAQRLGPMDI